MARLAQGHEAFVGAGPKQGAARDRFDRGSVPVQELACAAEIELAVEIVGLERAQSLEHRERVQMVIEIEKAAPEREQHLAPVDTGCRRAAELAVPGQRLVPALGGEAG